MSSFYNVCNQYLRWCNSRPYFILQHNNILLRLSITNDLLILLHFLIIAMLV